MLPLAHSNTKSFLRQGIFNVVCKQIYNVVEGTQSTWNIFCVIINLVICHATITVIVILEPWHQTSTAIINLVPCLQTSTVLINLELCHQTSSHNSSGTIIKQVVIINLELCNQTGSHYESRTKSTVLIDRLCHF